jgi:signal transduction histidine kinase
MVICDEQRIKQILLGLQSNAIKFTEKGYVKIRVAITGSTLKIEVEDTGIGIPKESQDKMFKLFGFLQDSKQLNTNGIGLGLVIAQQVVEKFNGKVSFTSEEGKGSTFTFTFQLESDDDLMNY